MAKATQNTTMNTSKGGETMLEKRVLFNKKPKLPAFSLGFPIERVRLLLLKPDRSFAFVEHGRDLMAALEKTDGKYHIRQGWGIYPQISGLTSIELRDMDERTLVQRNSESGSVRAALRPQRFTLTRKDPANTANQVYENIVGYDNTDVGVMSVEELQNLSGAFIEEALIDMGDETIAKSFRDSGYEALRPVTTKIARTIIVTTNEVQKYEIFGAYFANPAQVRKGEMAYFRIAKTSDRTEAFVIANDAGRRIGPLFERFLSQYNLSDFGKVKDGVRTMNADKDAKRVPLNDGGSRKSVLMDLVGPMVFDEEKVFENGDGSEGRARVYRSVNPVPEMGNQIVKFAVGSDIINRVNADDALITGVDGGSISVDTIANLYGGVDRYLFSKNLMDGSGLFDTTIGDLLKQEGLVFHEGQGVQGRFPGVKGLFIPTPELLERTGVHAYFGEGAVKLDPSTHLVEGTFDFSILQATRIEVENESSVVSTQALIAMETPAQVLRQLQLEATHKVHASLEDAALGLELLGATDAETEEELAPNDIVHRLQVDGRCLEDGAFRRRYVKLISKMSEKLQYGAVMAEKVRMRHMITDPYAILVAIESAFKTGKVVFPESIPANTVLAANAEGGARTGEAVAARFPLVSYYEPRKVQAISLDELGADAKAYYTKYLGLGFFQGLVMFSVHDMITEAMSGADFDGDTCLLIFNESLVGSMKDYPMFLDYTARKVNGVVQGAEGGCPFSDPTPALSIEEVLGVWMPEVLKGRVEQVEKDGFLTWNINFQEEDVQNHPQEVFFVWQQMAAAKTLKESKRAEIGEWSNRTTIAQDILAEVRLELDQMVGLALMGDEDAQQQLLFLQQEEKELVDLIKWLTNAVRWAIDEAKHGGAFKIELKEQLAIFLDKVSTAGMSFEDFQEKFGRAAIRFFIGR